MGVGARILGRGKSQAKANGGKGPLSRKAPPNTDPSPSEKPSLTPSERTQSTISGNDRDSSYRSDEQLHYYTHLFAHLPPNSLIPDPLLELPPWFGIDADAWNVASLISFRSRYPMHNPAGPRWYQNIHLSPPQEKESSQFSASFPPIPTAAERSQESTRLRTPSASPLPTPNSSQLRIVDPTGRVRTRKISQTDNVDMLDGTDPWGQQWHHDSPYDIGGLNRDASPDPEERRRSFTYTGNRHKSVTPSPLSQSTSAVHLHASEPMGAGLPRRLSKRRKPFSGLFGSQSQDNFHAKHASAPHELSPLAAENAQRQKMLRRRSTAGPPPSPSALLSADMASGKKEKHGSFMGRLARRFSVMRKPEPAANGIGGDSPHDGADAEPSATTEQATIGAHSHPATPAKRVPPPSLDGDTSTVTGRPQSSAEQRASAMMDFGGEEEPLQSKLTVVNPDEPAESLTGGSPVGLTPSVPSVPSATGTESSSRADGDVSTSEWEEHPDVPVTTSPIAITETPASPPTIPSLSPEPVSPLQAPVPSPSPPLPEIPRQSLASALNLDHSLPPTPRTERPLSLVSERTEPSTTFLSSPRTQAQETNFSNSSTNLTAYAPSSVSPAMSAADDPGLRRASIVANPPTPHVRPMIIFPAKSTQVSVTSSPIEMSPKPRDGSPKKEGHQKSSSSTRRRETETYTLVRSPSGTARSAGDVITAMGEQWEVVQSQAEEGSRKSRRKERSGSKEVESPIQEEGEYHHHRRQRSVNGRPAAEPMTASSSRSTRTPSVDTERRQRGTVSSRKERRSSSKQRESDVDTAKATSVPNPRNPLRHERALSAGARPTSDLQFDPTALRARDAWEKDRLWKANSMSYAPDGTPLVSTPPTIGDGSRTSTVFSADMQMAGAIPSTSDLHLQRSTTLPSPHAASLPHGTSHTYFTMGPYQGSHTIPAVYVPNVASHASSSQPHAGPNRRRQVSLSFSERVPFTIDDKRSDPPSLTRNYIGNPLPDPPRISPFQAAPLPPSLVVPLGGNTNAQYAGVPTRY